MPDPSQIRTKDGRGGLSRSAAKAVQKARRAHTDDLLVDIFGAGSVAEHFKQHPLDGETVISAVEVPRRGGDPRLPPPQPANRETAPQAKPKPKPKPKAAPDLAFALSQAQMGLSIEQTLLEVPVGITGGEYQAALEEMNRPPNTDLF